jgi:hypothetical protein
MSDWKSRATPVNSNSDWKSRATSVQASAADDEPSIIGSAARKLLSGAEGGFSDELAGINEAATRMVGGVNDKGERFTPYSKEDNEIDPTLDWETLKHAYNRARDHRRDELKKDSEAHPIISGAAELGGAILSPINKLVGGMSAARGGLALGAINGLGNSDADNVADMALDTGKSAAIGGTIGSAIDGVSSLAGKGTDYLKKLASEKLGQNVSFTPAPNQQEIESAAQGLGLNNIPKALLTDNPTYQKMESGLAQSGSLPAKSVRDQYNSFFKGIDDASGKISDLKTPDSDFSLGQTIQKTLGDKVNEMRKPVSEMYNDLTPQLKNIPVDEGVVNKAFGALKRDPLFQSADGKVMLDEYKNIALQQPELLSLKEWRSTIGDSVSSMSSPLDAKRAEALQKVVTAVRDNSIEAQKLNLPKSMHGEVDNFINQMALADSAHASNVNDINSIKGLLGNKDFKSPTNFLNKLGEAKESDLAERASNLDISSLRNMQEKFPEIFEKAKTAKLNDMIQRSSPGGTFKENTFLKQYENMDKELKNLIFDPKMQSHIENLKTVRQAIPEKLGPSGTPEGEMMMQMLSPKRNLMDYGIKKILNGAASPQAAAAPVGSGLQNITQPAINSVLQFAPKQTYPSVMPRAAEGQDDSTMNKMPDKNNLLQKTQGSKYSQVLQNAAQRGDDSLNAAHFVLAQRDPEYRKQIGAGE